MRNFRGFMMRVSIEMPVKIRRKIRCGIGAEGDNLTVFPGCIIRKFIMRGAAYKI